MHMPPVVFFLPECGKLFNNTIYTVVGQVEDGNLGIQLLDVSPHQYTVGDNIVYAINKL